MRQINIPILAGDDSLGSVTGSKVDSGQLVSASFQSVFGDVTAVGVVKIQASNDPGAENNLAQNFTPTNWSDIPNATSAIASGVGPMITIANMTYRWVRAVYTRTSGGSTTVMVNMNALGI